MVTRDQTKPANLQTTGSWRPRRSEKHRSQLALANMFIENFKAFAADVSAEVKLAGPAAVESTAA